MDPEKSANEIEKRKKWLFHIPIPDWLVYPISVLELIVIFARAYSLFQAVLFSIAEVLALIFLVTNLQTKQLFNARQSVLLADIFYSLPALLIYLLPRESVYIIGLALTSYPLALSYIAAGGSSLISIPIIFIFFFPMILISRGFTLMYIMSIFTLDIILTYIAIHEIDKYTKRIIGIRGSRFGASFFRAWFNKNDEEYEQYLQQLSIKKSIATNIMYFIDKITGTPLGSLVITDVHPGPFHEVGSSTLPLMISDNLEKATNAPCLVLRGKGSHENDMPSKKLAFNFSKLIAESLPKPLVKTTIDPPENWRIYEKAYFDQRRAGPFTMTSLLLEDNNLIVLSKAPLPCDDIPQNTGDYLEALGCKLADAHNSGPLDGYSTLNYFPPSNVDQIHDGILRLLKNKITPEDFFVGFSHINYKASLNTGICDGGAVALSWKTQDKRGILVSFQGNNMISGLRDKIIEELKTLGFKDVEVATTDNHQLSTSLQSVNKYSMVGAEDQRAVINMAIEAAKLALSKEKYAVILAQKRLDEVKIIGSENLEKINEAIKTSIPILEKYSFVSLILLAALGASFTWIL